MPSTPHVAPGSLQWIELVTGFGCNCRCRVCSGRRAAGDRTMGDREIEDWLVWGRNRGASGVWFGGGEPTLHPRIAPAIERAAALGYSRIRLQSNGIRFAYPAFADRLAAAGLREVAVSFKGGRALTHEAINQTPGSFAALTQGIGNLVRAGVRVEADVLLTRNMLAELEGMVEGCRDLGMLCLNLWLLSLHGLGDEPAVQTWLPSLAEVSPVLHRTGIRADSAGLELVTLHTPPCTLQEADRRRYRPSSTWKLLVVLPDGEAFWAEDSPMEGGQFAPGCADCAYRTECLGLRADYVAEHGWGDVRPISVGERDCIS